MPFINPAREDPPPLRGREESAVPGVGLGGGGRVDMFRRCMLSSKHETEASLSVSVLPNIRAGTPSCSHFWLRSLYLQLGVAPTYCCLLQEPATHRLS